LLKEGIHINQTIAAGDGVMILPMLNLAGLGAFTLNLQL
jgi:phosphoserine phosphatase